MIPGRPAKIGTGDESYSTLFAADIFSNCLRLFIYYVYRSYRPITFTDFTDASSVEDTQLA